MAWRGRRRGASPEGYARAPTAAGLGGKLGRAAQRELDGRAGRPETLPPGTTQLVGVARPSRRFSKERLGPAPEPEAAL